MLSNTEPQFSNSAYSGEMKVLLLSLLAATALANCATNGTLTVASFFPAARYGFGNRYPFSAFCFTNL